MQKVGRIFATKVKVAETRWETCDEAYFTTWDFQQYWCQPKLQLFENQLGHTTYSTRLKYLSITVINPNPHNKVHIRWQ